MRAPKLECVAFWLGIDTVITVSYENFLHLAHSFSSRDRQARDLLNVYQGAPTVVLCHEAECSCCCIRWVREAGDREFHGASACEVAVLEGVLDLNCFRAG